MGAIQVGVSVVKRIRISHRGGAESTDKKVKGQKFRIGIAWIGGFTTEVQRTLTRTISWICNPLRRRVMDPGGSTYWKQTVKHLVKLQSLVCQHLAHLCRAALPYECYAVL